MSSEARTYYTYIVPFKNIECQMFCIENDRLVHYVRCVVDKDATDEIIAEFAGEHFMHEVDLTDCPNLTDASLYAIVKGCGSHLMDLNISGCKNISQVAIDAVVKGCTKLKKFIGIKGTVIFPLMSTKAAIV